MAAGAEMGEKGRRGRSACNLVQSGRIVKERQLLIARDAAFCRYVLRDLLALWLAFGTHSISASARCYMAGGNLEMIHIKGLRFSLTLGTDRSKPSCLLWSLIALFFHHLLYSSLT